MKLQFVAVLLLWAFIGRGQEIGSPFKLDKKTEIVFLSTAVVSTITGYTLTRSLAPLSPSDVGALNASSIWSPDRIATTSYSQKARHLSDLGLASAFSMSLVFLSKRTPRKEYSKLFVIGAETAFYTIGLTMMTKGITKRIRPYAYNASVDMRTRTSQDARQSFFSGHASITSAACFFAAQTASQYDFSAFHKKLIWVTAISIPAFVGTMRVLAGRHFPTDVLVGYSIGAFAGCGIPFIHQKKPSSFSFRPSINSFSLSYTF